MNLVEAKEPAPSLDAVLAQIRGFPSLPCLVDEIIDLVDRRETTARDIEAVMQKDQALTAKLLRLVNSSFYGFPHQITTISRAVGIIGFEGLRNLVFSTSVMSLFDSTASAIFVPTEFWKHSIGTALAAKEIARRLGEKEIEEFFVAGLVHDIGKLVHHQYFREPFQQACKAAATRDILLRDAERELLPATHDQTARLLLDHWRFPRRLVTMVAHHHAPLEAHEFRKQATVIHLADILCRAKGLGSGGDRKIPMLERRAWDDLGLTFGDLEQVMGRLEEEFEPAAAVLTA